jgi:CO/xanthine dehydrogenase FAD-binding subunit
VLQRFERPKVLSEALALMSGNARPICGGTDIMIQMGLGIRVPELLVDLKLVEGLDELGWEGDVLNIGASVTIERICRYPGLKEDFFALYEGCRDIGSAQIRERASIAGNIAHASPCADSVPGLIVSGASVLLAKEGGERVVELEKFFLGPGKTVMQAGEIIVKVMIPRPSKDFRSSFAKIKRVKGHDLALVNVALSVEGQRLRCAIGSCAPTVVTIDLPTFTPSDQGLQNLLALVDARISPIDDVRASKAYRREMAAVLTKRLWHEVLSTKEESNA